MSRPAQFGMSALPSADADLHGASIKLYCCEVADWCTRPAHAVDLTSVAVTAELLLELSLHGLMHQAVQL